MYLKEYRKKGHLTGQQFADLLGISRSHYTHLEIGYRMITDELLDKLSAILTIDKSTLKEQAEDFGYHYQASKSWIYKMRVKGKPCLNAFIFSINGNKELINRELFEDFMLLNFQKALSDELNKFPELITYLEKSIIE